MSTLVIEGKRRLSGRVQVEGNKNAALPLLAACLLTEDECVLTNVPRIGDVEVMARLLADVGAEVDGIGTTTLRVRTPRVTTNEPDRRAGGAPARLGAAAGAAAGADGPCQTGARRAATFPARRSIATHLGALVAMGARAGSRAPDHALEAPERAARRLDLPRRGVGDRHRDGDSGRRDGRGHDRDPPRGLRTARRRAVRVPAAGWASA